MAGTSLEFDPVEFRAAIHEAMAMGMPPEVARRPTFFFPYRETHAVADSGGDPFDWTAQPVVEGEPAPEGPRPPVQVLCAWETAEGGESFTDMGTLNTDEALITFLDVDYELVRGFDRVLLDDNTYEYVKELPARGLWEVGIHQVLVRARDES